MQTKNVVVVLLGVIAALGVMSVFVSGTDIYIPAPARLNETSDTTFNYSQYDDESNDAFAGNITELTMDVIFQTKAWQGYFGNISGTITLDDANNWTFYNWSTAEPQGEVYASTNSSIRWENVTCFDFYNDTELNVTVLEERYGIEEDDDDSINSTFNWTDHDPWHVGYVTLTGCPTTYIFQEDSRQLENFENIMIYEPGEDAIIFGARIENDEVNLTDLVGFDNTTTDFQMLVLEDGHDNDTDVTTYYFFVELE